MPHNTSRHNLPLSSRIFSNSTSRVDLRSERRALAEFDFSNDSQFRSTPDLAATALPEYVQQVPPIPHRFGGPAPVQTGPPNSGTPVGSPPRSPAKSAKKAAWYKLKDKVKNLFTLNRHKNRNSMASDSEREPMVIGMPSGFQHVRTFGVGGLRGPDGLTPAERATRVAGNGGESLAMQMGVRDGHTPSAVQTAMSGGEAAAGAGGVGEAAASGRLGSWDSEETAVEDYDDGSMWEDVEGTSMFSA